MTEQNSSNIANKTAESLDKEQSQTNISNLEMRNNSSNNKSSFSPILKRTLIIVIATVVAAIIAVIIIVIVRHKNKSDGGNTRIIINPDGSSSNFPSSSNIPSSSRDPSSSSVPPSSSGAPSSSSSSKSDPEPIKPSDISYEEAEKLLDTEIIGKNHKILNESYESITESFEVFNNLTTDLKPISSNISFTTPEFLDNLTDNTLKIVKDDINLYNSKYEELEEKANNLTETVSESIKILSTPINNMKESVDEIYEQFENTTKSFSLPLFLEKNGIINSTELNNSRRRLYSEKLKEYKDEVEKLNNIYNSFFIYIKITIEIIVENMREIPNSVKDINENIVQSILDYEKLLNKFGKDDDTQNIHENLLSIKQSFLDIKENMNDKIKKIVDRISFLEDLHKNNTFNLKNFESETLIIITNINRISEEIILEINDMRKQNGEKELKYSNPKASSLIADSIINSIDNSFKILIDIEIVKKNEILSIIIIINVEERTSLDLLFVMDITGSMYPYVEQAKANIIDIINKIVDGCPGIDINLGFIGYRDIFEENRGDITDIEFTKDHDGLKNNITNIYAYGGGDAPEDVAWAFEKALNKTWKSNARFIVFVADAPNHGDKYNNGDGYDVYYYDDYPDGIPDRRDLEDIIKELADNSVSMFCMKLTEDTDRMLEIFGDVYKNYEKAQFKIVPMISENNFVDVVVGSAINVYENQRMNDGSISFESNKNKLRILLIEINPILTKITNEELYKNNNGHPYVSEYFDQDREIALKEMKEDLEFSSHGKVKVEFVRNITENEFPKYKILIELSNGTRDYKLDEETYISMSKKDDNPDKGDWNKLVNDPKYKEIDSYQFDYNNFVQKHQLDILRKNNVFDQVWIYGIDPLSTYETMMIGSDPFWINGLPLKEDCKNFMVVAVSISRRDANLHVLGHGFENIFSYAFNGERNSYDKEYDDDTPEKYDKLNYWEKFSLIDKNSKGDNAGVGNIHFPFNGEYDYDYYNENEVYSNWEYWENYPNINGEKKKYNNDAWMNFKGNENIINDTDSCKDPDRLYIRFWMYLLPHIDGYTETGHLNNWWDYVTNCDYVTSINSENKIIDVTIGEEVYLTYKVVYKSGSVETIRNINSGNNIKINGDCVSFEDNKLIGSKKGSCSVTIYRDGNSLDFKININ